MALIVKTDVNMATQYQVGNVSTKYNGKKQKVLFRVLCDDTNLKEAVKLAKSSSNVLSVVYQGITNDFSEYDLNGVSLVKEFNVGDNVSSSDIVDILDSVSDNITPVLLLPETFKDLQLIYNLCNQYDRIRFVGGKLFPINGVRLGYCTTAKLEKCGAGIINSNMFNPNFEYGNEVLDCAGLEFTVSTKASRSTEPRKTSSGASHKTSAPKTISFTSLSGFSINQGQM